MKKFNRRIYESIPAFATDFKAIVARRGQMKALMRGEVIDGAFRERLMLAVTAVNDCRYCSFAHTRQALVEGVDKDEIKALRGGIVKDCPEGELPGLMYAQHWAEARGKPEPAARERLIEEYGGERAAAIELTLQTIQMGNLLGNTTDYILYRLSFGRLGV